MKKLFLLCICLLILSSVPAFSQKKSKSKQHKSEETTSVVSGTKFHTTITISPFHLALPVVELTGEFALQPKISLSAIGGIGSYESFSVFELGSQFNYYLIGDFDQGMQGGVELLYVYTSGSVSNISGIGQGLSLGPFIGYKGAFSFGLSIDIQLGIAVMAVNAEAGGSTASVNAVYPLFNFNLGWSF
jgi:hypothetical protein